MVNIYIDPGHGGNDPGAQANGLKEKDVTLKISNQIHEYLQEYQDVSVKRSRTGDQTVSLTARTNEANAWGAHYFLSIHINAGGGTGYEDYIHQNLSDQSDTARLRNDIHAEVIKLNDLPNRGKKKANFHVLRESNMSAMLGENGFIDHATDAAKMKQSSWIKAVARGYTNGLAKAVNLKKKSGGGEDGGTKNYLEILVDSLWTYHTANWDDRAVIVNKQDVFTIRKDKFKVGGGSMYQLKSGLYITANPTYVRAYSPS